MLRVLARHRVSIARQRLDQPRALVVAQPAGVSGAIGQVEQRDEAKDHRRQPLDEKQPLPAVEPADAAHRQQRARQRRADRCRRAMLAVEELRDSARALRAGNQ